MKAVFVFCLLLIAILSNSFRIESNIKRNRGISKSLHIKDEKVFNIKEYGAIGDGKTDNATAIQKAIDACSAAGGGRVLIPSGSTFLSGPFNLKSFVELYVESGATVLANPDEKVYTQSAFRENKGEGTLLFFW